MNENESEIVELAEMTKTEPEPVAGDQGTPTVIIQPGHHLLEISRYFGLFLVPEVFEKIPILPVQLVS